MRKLQRTIYLTKKAAKVESITERDNETGLPCAPGLFRLKIQYQKPAQQFWNFAAGTDKVAKETSFNEGKPIHITEYKDNEEKVIDNSLSDSGKTPMDRNPPDKKNKHKPQVTIWMRKGGIEYVTFRDENFNPVKEYSLRKRETCRSNKLHI